MYLLFVIKIQKDLELKIIWNKGMSLYIQLTGILQHSVCGLCGNLNGNLGDEFRTRTNSIVSSTTDFGNSWKEDCLCADVEEHVHLCDKNPFRVAWARKTCSIIKSPVFKECHSMVNHNLFYENCVQDACGCELVGDCECLCEAVAVYAKICLDKGICIDWRKPDFCPVYCDYFNIHEQRNNRYEYIYKIKGDWHYQPCLCPWNLRSIENNMEGCYNCSQGEYLDAERKSCVPCGKYTRLFNFCFHKLPVLIIHLISIFSFHIQCIQLIAPLII
uniref:Mucin-6-like n=1 Tax=Callorhinchus milii TaxID=7868 RepID=A0A4W3H3P0_CALMI